MIGNTPLPDNKLDGCKCNPLNDEILYTGNCPIHQAKMTVTLEGLKKSSNPEVVAIVKLIDQLLLEARIDEVKKAWGKYAPGNLGNPYMAERTNYLIAQLTKKGNDDD